MNNHEEINIDSMLDVIGNIIQEQRELLGLTVAELSQKSGVSVGVISDLINHRGRVPTLANFIKLASALQLPEDMFTSLIQGKIEKVQEANKCSKEDVEHVLLRYGVKKDNLSTLIALIDTFIQTQSTVTYTRSRHL